MPSWIGRFLSSSVGKKTVMALTGLSLVGFLVVHLLGNFTLYTGGIEGFNEYAAKLEDLGGLLMAAEIGLFAIFVIHMGLALRIARENKRARQENYRIRATMGHSTAASRGLPLRHAIQSAFQSLGLENPNWSPLLRLGAQTLAWALAVGFASFPIYCLLTTGAASAAAN